MKGSGQKVLERYTGKGHGVAQGLSPGWAAFLPSQFCPERKALCCLLEPLSSSACCYRAPLNHQCPQRHKQTLCPPHHAHVPGNFLAEALLNSTTVHFSKKKIFLKRIRRKMSVGISSFSESVILAVMHTLIWEKV